jgi:hypothetical protein
VGIDCKTSAFPSFLCSKTCSANPTQVKTITINFSLDQDYIELVLQLDRDGDETTVVMVDGIQNHQVTHSMLGGRMEWEFGSYGLELGEFSMGDHSITMTVADEESAQGHQWDALTLYGWKKDEAGQ